MNGYELLNEVGSGGTLSSLFTILSLFTEDVQMSWQDDHPDTLSEEPSPFDEGIQIPRNRTRRADSDVSQFDLGTPGSSKSSKGTPRRASVSSTASTVRSPSAHPHSPEDSPPIILEPPQPERRQPRRRPTQDLRGVVARATVDTTLAVIPAEAFRRLTKKFPKATSHIVQGSHSRLFLCNYYRRLPPVILTRFSRVTFNAAHKYLGLTSEVLRTEKAINDIACHPLPASFYVGGGLQQLRHRFDGTPSSPSGSGADYFSFTKSPARQTMSPLPAKSREASSSSSSLGPSSDGVASSTKSSANTTSKKSRGRAPSAKSSRHMVQAGDLLVPKGSPSDVFRPLSRTFSVLKTPRVPYSFSEDKEEKPIKEENPSGPRKWSAEDFDLREEVMSCIAKSIGLLQPPLSGSDSIEVSPAFPSTDFRTPSSTGSSFSSPFSSLSLLDAGDDMSSMTGTSTLNSTGNGMSGLDNEVEILFYAAGSTLAKAGDVNTGNVDCISIFGIRLIAS